MCKHILNPQVNGASVPGVAYDRTLTITALRDHAQVSVRAQCCRRWFDCPECHAEVADHPLRKTTEMVLACKKCKKVFRKDLRDYEEADEFCPHCDNHYVIEAETPEAKQQESAKAVGITLVNQ